MVSQAPVPPPLCRAGRLLPVPPASSLRSLQPCFLPVEIPPGPLLCPPTTQSIRQGRPRGQRATERPPLCCVGGGCRGARTKLLPGFVTLVTLINIVSTHVAPRTSCSGTQTGEAGACPQVEGGGGGRRGCILNTRPCAARPPCHAPPSHRGIAGLREPVGLAQSHPGGKG